MSKREVRTQRSDGSWEVKVYRTHHPILRGIAYFFGFLFVLGTAIHDWYFLPEVVAVVALLLWASKHVDGWTATMEAKVEANRQRNLADIEKRKQERQAATAPPPVQPPAPPPPATTPEKMEAARAKVDAMNKRAAELEKLLDGGELKKPKVWPAINPATVKKAEEAKAAAHEAAQRLLKGQP
jgi:hypothetical protein